MFDYNHLSPNRRVFVDAAIKTFPNLIHDKSITRNQIAEVCEKHKLNIPQWLTNAPGNRVNRGVFHFPVPTHNETVEEIIELTDEEIEENIKTKFATIDTCIRSVATGVTKALIISGPPGCGKSTEVYNILGELEDSTGLNFVFASGRSASTGLYKLLYDNRFSNCVTVLDDIDSVFESVDSLNILKKACDMNPVRHISWLTETKFVSDEDGADIPKTFDYEGSIIFITNINFDNLIARGSKISAHLEALISRSLYIDVGINTTRESLVRIKQKIKDGMLTNKGFTKKEQDEIYFFIEENAHLLREVSLRMCVKIANLVHVDKEHWKNIARETCFKKR